MIKSNGREASYEAIKIVRDYALAARYARNRFTVSLRTGEMKTFCSRSARVIEVLRVRDGNSTNQPSLSGTAPLKAGRESNYTLLSPCAFVANIGFAGVVYRFLRDNTIAVERGKRTKGRFRTSDIGDVVPRVEGGTKGG